MTELLVTQESYDKMKAEIEELKSVKMPEIIKRIEEAIKLGDLSENAEYHAAKDEQGLTAAKIRELESKLLQAKIVEKSNTDCVEIGSRIVVIDDSGNEKSIEIVDATQADPSTGKISNESPMGKAFVGKCSGAEVKVELPAGVRIYKIKSVS